MDGHDATPNRCAQQRKWKPFKLVELLEDTQIANNKRKVKKKTRAMNNDDEERERII